MDSSHAFLGRLLPAVCEVADAAARKVLEIYDSDFGVEWKRDQTPVTAADLVAHSTLVEELTRLAPFPVLSEEERVASFAERQHWHRYWLIDPLDGTKEFVARSGEFTVNVALIEEQRAILGVVHVPVTGEIYFAASGHGARKSAPGLVETPLRTRQADPAHLVVVGSRSHGASELRQFVDQLPGAPKLVVRGSAVKACLVAEGVADVYPRFSPTSEWDTAAAQCVVEQAGGVVTKFDGAPLLYNTKESLLNPSFVVVGDTNYDWCEALRSMRETRSPSDDASD